MASWFQASSRVDKRVRFLKIGLLVIFGILLLRLASLQVLQGNFYRALAEGQQAVNEQIQASRGSVLVEDWKTGEEYEIAANTQSAFVFADPRLIDDAEKLTKQLSAILGYDIPSEETEEEPELDILEGVDGDDGESEEPEALPEEDEVSYAKYEQLLARLSKEDDPYEPIASSITDDQLQRIEKLNHEAVNYYFEEERHYPEGDIGGHIVGFLGKAEDGTNVGRYGAEGAYDAFLAGQDGNFRALADASRSWVRASAVSPAEDGGDVLLTVDRTIQYYSCDRLRQAVEDYQADGGALVVIEPSTGAIIAMCSVPDYNPDDYASVEDVRAYTNQNLLHAYEPGSIFKPLIVAAGIDAGVIEPETIYEDTGEVKIDRFTIRNSDLKANGWQSMTQVLEKSLNTGMIFVMRQLGLEAMEEYIRKFGFGEMTGVDFGAESAGNIRALNTVSEIFYATASYGQGITTTPLQMAAAYATLANDGMRMRPYMVAERRYENGYIETTEPEPIGRAITELSAKTVGGMMVQVVENGHGDTAGVEGYYVAGKTGTAQVAKEDGRGYKEDHTKASFAGYAPVEDPQFAMIVMLDRPRTSPWASSTAAPVWGDIADFILRYLEIPPTRL
jgi:cell division protein FtsI/penicillin-binding protein 2